MNAYHEEVEDICKRVLAVEERSGWGFQDILKDVYRMKGHIEQNRMLKSKMGEE